jgi:hypothetical protein
LLQEILTQETTGLEHENNFQEVNQQNSSTRFFFKDKAREKEQKEGGEKKPAFLRYNGA